MSRSDGLIVVSGGQTGVDRAALDAAIDLGLPHAGYCPRGRRAEDGRIPERYALVELPAAGYAARTERNVVESDGTLVVRRGPASGGTALTLRLARRHRRPLLEVDLAAETMADAARRISAWLRASGVARLNVAGPRESQAPGIGEQARGLLVRVFGSEPD